MYIQTLHNRVRYTKHNKIDCRFMSMKLLKSQYTYKRIYIGVYLFILCFVLLYIFKIQLRFFLKIGNIKELRNFLYIIHTTYTV